MHYCLILFFISSSYAHATDYIFSANKIETQKNSYYKTKKNRSVQLSKEDFAQLSSVTYLRQISIQGLPSSYTKISLDGIPLVDMSTPTYTFVPELVATLQAEDLTLQSTQATIGIQSNKKSNIYSIVGSHNDLRLGGGVLSQKGRYKNYTAIAYKKRGGYSYQPSKSYNDPEKDGESANRIESRNSYEGDKNSFEANYSLTNNHSDLDSVNEDNRSYQSKIQNHRGELSWTNFSFKDELESRLQFYFDLNDRVYYNVPSGPSRDRYRGEIYNLQLDEKIQLGNHDLKSKLAFSKKSAFFEGDVQSTDQTSLDLEDHLIYQNLRFEVQGEQAITSQKSYPSKYRLKIMRGDTHLALSYETLLEARVPTLYQRYSLYGNKNLKSEKRYTHQLQLQNSTDKIQHSILFYMHSIYDLVEFEMRTSQYENLNRVQIYGGEYNLHVTPHRKIDLSNSITLQRTKESQTHRELIERPRVSIKSNIEFRPSENCSTRLSHSYIGPRKGIYYNRLPSYRQMDFAIHYTKTTVTTYGQLKNIFNNQKELTSNLVNPGREYEIGIVAYF